MSRAAKYLQWSRQFYMPDPFRLTHLSWLFNLLLQVSDFSALRLILERNIAQTVGDPRTVKFPLKANEKGFPPNCLFKKGFRDASKIRSKSNQAWTKSKWTGNVLAALKLGVVKFQKRVANFDERSQMFKLIGKGRMLSEIIFWSRWLTRFENPFTLLSFDH